MLRNGDLPNPTGISSTEHYACDGGPDCAEVVMERTYQTCRDNCKDGNRGVLRSEQRGVFLCHVRGLLVRLPKRIYERGGGWQAA